jgi:thioredoxin-related protein
MTVPIVFSACTQAQPELIESVTDLSQLAQEAKVRNIPMMLFVSAPSCRYCHQLERDVIVPMLKNARYSPLVLVRRLDLGQDSMIDFDAMRKDPIHISGRYKAQMTPTILFLSPSGDTIADKIQGVVQDIDQYGGMIDARLNRSLEALGNSARIVHE